LLNLYELYKNAKAKNIIFYYSGPIAHASIEGVAATLRKNLQYEGTDEITSNAVFSVFIEQVQNILNYSAEKFSDINSDDEDLRAGVVAIGYEEGFYCIYCGNKVYNQDIPKIKENIDSVRNLDKEHLKALYKERRRMEPPPSSKGAGLGLIEMARKAVKPIDYTFIPMDEEYSFFTIKVVTGREKI
jgi:hypothetical protein